MNKENITIQDCLDMYEKKGQVVILENGQVAGFRKVEDETINCTYCNTEWDISTFKDFPRKGECPWCASEQRKERGEAG